MKKHDRGYTQRRDTTSEQEYELQEKQHETMPEVFERLAKVLEAEALELIPGEGDESGDMCIPYMMNDALEYILVLENVKMTGEFNRAWRIAEAQILQADPEEGLANVRYALVLRFEDGTRCSVFFDRIHEKVHAYACHEIGHFWVEGAEQWRRVVYILGTIHDKYAYFGDRFCNEKEQELMWLMEFAPLRDWSPIGESIRERYLPSKQGINAMIEMAEAVEDREYVSLLKKYRRFHLKRWEEELHRRLQEPERWALWNRIRTKIVESQEGYDQRDYGEEQNQRRSQLRADVDRRLRAQGFRGCYPDYWGWQLPAEDTLAGPSCDTVSGMIPMEQNPLKGEKLVLVTAAEEHPFTELERSDYTFEVQLMVSDGPVESLAPNGLPEGYRDEAGQNDHTDREKSSEPMDWGKERQYFRWNLGFFRGPELEGRIHRP